jgi:hypothetical protein
MALSAGLFIPAYATAEDYSGSYQGPKLAMTISRSPDGYSGQIRLGQQAFPFNAREDNGRLVGSFASDGGNFDFSAAVAQGHLTLVSGNNTYDLQRQAAGAAAMPGGAAAGVAAVGSADALSRYKQVMATNSGKTLSTQMPGVTSALAAYKTVFPDLQQYFGARPSITGAYQNGDNDKQTFATFDAQLNGQPVKGIVSPKFDSQGATVYVVYCRADAPPTEWKKLMGLAPNVDVPLTTYNFPDGTGSIGLARGYKTQSQSLVGTVLVDGAGDQHMLMGASISAVTPDSYLARQQVQAQQNARMLHMPPPPQMPLTIAAMGSDPGQTLANLVPSFSAASQKAGGPAITLDRIIDQKPLTNAPTMNGGKAAVVTYDVTFTTNGSPKHYRASALVSVTPLTPGSYMVYMTESRAPVQTFDHDILVMWAMINSIKVNEQVAQAKLQAQRQTNDAIFKMSMDSAKRAMTAEAKQSADFDEILVGSRTVENTDTGQRFDVNLGDSHQIVQQLNAQGQYHYKEIPLRDEVFPQ